MNRFPRFVFKPSGTIERAGGFYAENIVENQAEMDAMLSDGWFSNLSDAINPPEVVAFEMVDPVQSGLIPSNPVQSDEPIPEPIEDNAPPTREELEIKARELGIKFDGRIGDRNLTRLIERALEA
jgi:hypothetical protein